VRYVDVRTVGPDTWGPVFKAGYLNRLQEILHAMQGD
jgi:hypothetical protein